MAPGGVVIIDDVDLEGKIMNTGMCETETKCSCSGSKAAARAGGKMKDVERLSADKDGDDGRGGQSQLVLDSRTKTKKPSMYKVLMMNDDYTPMEFVVHVLQQFFNMSGSQATAIMLNVHRRGVGVCGVYSYEVAEAKATKVMDYARQNEHPLQLQLEKE